MNWRDISRTPSARHLQQFAGGLVVIALIVAWTQWRRGHVGIAEAALGVAALSAIVGAVRPQLLRPVYVAAMMAAFPIGWVVARVALAVVFFGVVTPMGLISRWAGRDRLQRRRDPSHNSYWRPKPPHDADSYFRQF